MKKLREVEEATPAPSSLTRATFGSGMHATAPRSYQGKSASTPATPPASTPAPKPYQPYSFINELRPADLELDPEPYSFINDAPPADLADLADLADVHPVDDEEEDESAAFDENDDRTIERYVPPSVRDLDYDTEMTSEVPSEWLDHLAAQARPSDRPAADLRPTAPPPPSMQPSMTPPPAPSFFGSFPPGSFPTPSAMLPVTSFLLPTPLPPSGMMQQEVSQPLQPQQPPQLQPRSNPIPWVPTPVAPASSEASPLRRGLLFFAAVILWVVLIAAALRVLIGH